jgi:hypothetical protein
VVVFSQGITPSNTVTIPIAANGKTCSDDSAPGVAQQFQAIGSQGSANIGALTIIESFGVTQGAAALAVFQRVNGFGNSVGNGNVSVGSCIVTNSLGTPAPSTSGLDAGTSLALSGPGGTSATLIQNLIPGQTAGTYGALLQASAFPASGGAFTVSSGNGGADVGGFSASVNLPGSFTWTNQSSISAVSSSTGVTVTWSGGAGGGLVSISGSVGATLGGKANSNVTFTCYAPVSAGTFTVSPAVLTGIPGGNGVIAVGVLSNIQPFSAGGLDFAASQSVIQYTKAVTFNGVRR